mgnify:CR=1 FL=1
MTLEKDKVSVVPPEDPRKGKALYGLTRTLVANMVQGVTQGFQRVLEINGVGYKAEAKKEKKERKEKEKALREPGGFGKSLEKELMGSIRKGRIARNKGKK